MTSGVGFTLSRMAERSGTQVGRGQAVRSTVDAIADAYVDECVERYPETATYLGVAGHDHEWGDYSPGGLAEQVAHVRRTIAALHSRGSGRRAGEHGQGGDARAARTGGRALRGAHHAFPGERDRRPGAGDPVDLRPDADRTPRMPGATSPPGCARSIVRWTGPRDAEPPRRGRATSPPSGRSPRPSTRSGPGRARPATTTSSRRWSSRHRGTRRPCCSDLTLGGRSRPARQFSRLRRLVGRSALAPLAPSLDAVGEERYALDSRYFLGAVIDLEETYLWGCDELQRIQEAAAVDRTELVGEPDIQPAYAALDADPGRRIQGAEAFRPGCRSSPTRPSATSRACTSTSRTRSRPSSAASRRPTTARSTTPIRPRTSPVPARCGGRCRTGIDTFSTWKEVTTVYHEGVPGHHLQIAPERLPVRSAQSVAAQAVLLLRATARAGRCTPSG